MWSQHLHHHPSWRYRQIVKTNGSNHYSDQETIDLSMCWINYICNLTTFLIRPFFNPNSQQSLFHQLTLNYFPNGFLQDTLWFFLENFRAGLNTLHIPHQFLFNFDSPNSAGVRRVFRPARYLFTKIKVYEATILR